MCDSFNRTYGYNGSNADDLVHIGGEDTIGYGIVTRKERYAMEKRKREEKEKEREKRNDGYD